MKINQIKSTKLFVFGITAATLLMVPSAKANLSLSLSSASYVYGYSAPSSAGSLLYQCDNNGHSNGLLQSSYNCSSGFSALNYCGGNTAQGNCFVLQCNNGGAFVWNLNNCWNGTDQINCNFNPQYYGCKGIEVYGNCQTNTNKQTSSVPEPSTVVAGALLLVPLGLQAIRQLRRRQPAA
jgi:hypothetical protein